MGSSYKSPTLHRCPGLHFHHIPYLHHTSHCSPKFRQPIFLQNPYFHPTSHSSPPSSSLSFNMAHLGVNVSDNIRCDVINPYLLTWLFWGRTLTISPPNPSCSPPSPPQPALFAEVRTLPNIFLQNPYLHPNPHCSPKFGLCRFFNIFLQNPYLLTWLIWRTSWVII